MSKMCRPTSEEGEESCNVCGTEFYPLPFLHFAGNMFSTSCSHVKELLPPTMFEKRMNDIASDALLAKIEEIFATRLVRFDERILGSYQHSIEHWIGSHPDLRPCDIAPMTMDASDEKHDETTMRMLGRYSWSPAPRRGSAPPGVLDLDSESKFQKKRKVALREYYYLAGNVFR